MNATSRQPRRVAALIMAAEAALMALFAVFGLVQWVTRLGSVGSASDSARIVTEAILVLVFAAGAGLLAKLWLGQSDWPRTPTIVWHVLLIPVAYGMGASGQYLICVVLAVVIVAAIAAAVVGGAEIPEPAPRSGD